MSGAKYKSHAFRATILLSPEDEHLREQNWGKHKGYAARVINHGTHNDRIYLHSLIMPPKSGRHVDHANGIKTDNRRENLRYVTYAQNQQNRKLQKNNKSGYKGVIWSKGKEKWQVYIRINKKLKHLGYFSDILEAAQAYNVAAEKDFGSYARTNSVQENLPS